jgi:hypothetical protein
MKRWVFDNRVIGALFGALIVLNAHAIDVGWYG